MSRHAWILVAAVLVVILGSCSTQRPEPLPESRKSNVSPRSPLPPPSPSQVPVLSKPTSPDPKPIPSPPKLTAPAPTPLPAPASAPPEAAVPQFPWPPPAASARQVVRRELLAASHRLARLGDVDGVLSDALSSAGYTEKSYWAVPRGFALATRLEQIDANGKSKPPPARWSAEMPRLSGAFSLSAYLRALFTADPGYYRIVVFVVTDVLFTESERSASFEEARNWLARGLNALPESLGSQPYGPNVVCTAMIYEFEKMPGSDPETMLPSPLDARAHLVGSGLWNALGGR